jgi:hypothetical protein
MKVALFSILVLSINSVNCNRISSFSSDDDSKVTKLVEKLINESNQKLAGIQDVAILDMAEQNGRSFDDAKQ